MFQATTTNRASTATTVGVDRNVCLGNVAALVINSASRYTTARYVKYIDPITDSCIDKNGLLKFYFMPPISTSILDFQR